MFKNGHGRTDFLVTNKEWLRFLIVPNCYRNHHAKFEINNSNMPKLPKKVIRSRLT